MQRKDSLPLGSPSALCSPPLTHRIALTVCLLSVVDTRGLYFCEQAWGPPPPSGP